MHSESEYADGDVHVSLCESHASLVQQSLSPYQGISKDKPIPHLKLFEFRREILCNPGREVLRELVRTAPDSPTMYSIRANVRVK